MLRKRQLHAILGATLAFAIAGTLAIAIWSSERREMLPPASQEAHKREIQSDGKKSQTFTLPRIIADDGELIDPPNAPTCSLCSISVSEMPEKFDSQILGFINWPRDYQSPQPASYGDNDMYRIVADGVFYTKVPPSLGEGGGFRHIGKILLDKSLNPLMGIWDAKKEGAVHTIVGKITMADYEFDSERERPLKFKITKNGYVYLEGNGTVKDLTNGDIHTLKQ